MTRTNVWRNLIFSIGITIIAVLFLTQFVQTGQTPPANQVAQTPPANQMGGMGETQTPASGVDLYKTNCSACHGDNGSGASAPPLNTGNWSDSSKVQAIVKTGKGSMPSFQGQLSDPQIKAIGDFVASLKK